MVCKRHGARADCGGALVKGDATVPTAGVQAQIDLEGVGVSVQLVIELSIELDRDVIPDEPRYRLGALVAGADRVLIITKRGRWWWQRVAAGGGGGGGGGGDGEESGRRSLVKKFKSWTVL